MSDDGPDQTHLLLLDLFRRCRDSTYIYIYVYIQFFWLQDNFLINKIFLFFKIKSGGDYYYYDYHFLNGQFSYLVSVWESY